MSTIKKENIIANLFTYSRTVKTTAGFYTNLGNYVKEEQAFPEPETTPYWLNIWERDTDPLTLENEGAQLKRTKHLLMDLVVTYEGPASTRRQLEADVDKVIGVYNAANPGGLFIQIFDNGTSVNYAPQAERKITGFTKQIKIIYKTVEFGET